MTLSLPEQLLLLAFHEKKEHTLNASLGFGLAGAVLAELLLRGKLERHRSTLVRRDRTLTSDPILNEALLIMDSLQQGQTPRYWINHLYFRMRRLRQKLTEQLAAKGLLTATKGRSLGLFPYRAYRLADPHPALALKDQIRQVIFRSFAPTPRQLAIIALSQPAGLKLFTREERSAAKARIDEALARDAISRAVAEAVRDYRGTAAAVIAVSAAASA
jgi:golgi phosphoprotein 3